jgi:hypothetical protein
LRIFGPKRDDVTRGWRKLHNLPTITRMMKSRRMRWMGHVSQIGEKRNPDRLLI